MKFRATRPVTALVIVVAAVIVLGLIFHGPLDRQLHRWKLLPEPEKLTELYFTHPNSLPSTYAPGQVLAVNFTTHNLEYQTVDYQYKITEVNQANNQSQTLATGNFSLKQNEYQRQSVNITTTDMGPHAKVEVELVNVHESIDYLLRREV